MSNPSPLPRAPQSGIRQPDRVVAFWSSVLVTVFILAFDVAIGLGAAGAPTREVAVGTSLLLALSFVALISSLHSSAPSTARVWTQIGSSFSILYAALLIWNYFLQLTVVRRDPQSYAWLTMDFTPHSAFWSLETIGYTLMSLSALSALPTLGRGSIERVIRVCLIANAIFALLGSGAYVLTGNPVHLLVLASLAAWSILFPIATALLALVLTRKREPSA